jgi:hypothetical protein
MARPLRIEYPGAIYHVLSRGDGKGPIFLDDGDGHDFIKTLAETCQKTVKGSVPDSMIFFAVGGSCFWPLSPSGRLKSPNPLFSQTAPRSGRGRASAEAPIWCDFVLD